MINVWKLTAPDNAFGRLLFAGRMWTETARLAMSAHDDDTRAFIALCRQLVPKYTMLSATRLKALHDLVLDLHKRDIDGAIVECGVWKGGSSGMMANAQEKTGRFRDQWLFDSFQGLPPPTAQDPPAVHKGYHEGWCHGDAARAREICLKMGLPESQLHIVQGWFHETFPTVEPGPIALLHIDADWYDPVKLCYERFYDFVRPGGVIVLDDYGQWEGCKIATTEFREARGITAPIIPIDRAGAYFIKPAD